jgi:hypothetical protein
MKGLSVEREEEKKERGDFGNGISIEGEFAFTKALGDFCKTAVGSGRFKGNYRFNLKDQMQQRARLDGKNMVEAVVVIVGGGGGGARWEEKRMK